MLASSVVDCGFESRSGQIKDSEMGICYFNAKHAAFRSGVKVWLARNHLLAISWREQDTFDEMIMKSALY
jgi:hypothetical protein